jgi:hypothetical protein
MPRTPSISVAVDRGGTGANLSQFNSKPVVCSEHVKFSLRGFSAKRMAYLLNGVQLWLLCSVSLDFYSGYAGAGVDVTSSVLTLASLILGFCCSGRNKGRFLPFALSIPILVMTFLVTPI